MKRFVYLVLFVGLATTGLQAQQDSLGVEKVGNQIFVLHKVLPKQTLFSLAQRYQTSISDIKKENPVLDNGMQIGQTLKIPFGGEMASTDQANQAFVTESLSHKVQAGETLFAISRKYNVQVSDIKKWNMLSSNNLVLGQSLAIEIQKAVKSDSALSNTKSLPDNYTPPVAQEPYAQDSAMQEEVMGEAEEDTPMYEDKPFEEVATEGLAEVIDESEPTNKFFALHRTAKVGTVIKVKNLMNNLTVYVRVIGTIPATSNNDDIIIKLNQRAYNHLKAVDKRFRVSLSFFQ